MANTVTYGIEWNTGIENLNSLVDTLTKIDNIIDSIKSKSEGVFKGIENSTKGVISSQKNLQKQQTKNNSTYYSSLIKVNKAALATMSKDTQGYWDLKRKIAEAELNHAVKDGDIKVALARSTNNIINKEQAAYKAKKNTADDKLYYNEQAQLDKQNLATLSKNTKEYWNLKKKLATDDINRTIKNENIKRQLIRSSQQQIDKEQSAYSAKKTTADDKLYYKKLAQLDKQNLATLSKNTKEYWNLKKKLATDDINRTIKNSTKKKKLIKESIKLIEKEKKLYESKNTANAKNMGDNSQYITSLRRLTAEYLSAYGVYRTATKVISIGSEFGQGIATVESIIKPTVTQLKELSAAARDLNTLESVGATAIEATQQLKYLGMAGFNASESMASLRDTMELARIGDVSFGEAADWSTNILKGFGLEVKRLTYVNNLLATAATSSNTSVQEMAEAFVTLAPAAASNNQSIADMTTVVGSLANAGIKGSLAGYGLSRMLIRLATLPKSASKAFKELDVEVTNSSGEMRSLIDILQDLKNAGVDTQQLKDIFGLHGIRTGTAALRLANDDMVTLRQTMLDVEGATRRMVGIKMDTLEGDTKKLKAVWAEFAIILEKKMEPALRKSVNFLSAIGRDWKGFALMATTATTATVALWGFNFAAKASAATMKLLKTSMKAHPFFLIAGATALAVGALIGYISSLKSANEKALELNKEQRDLAQTMLDTKKGSLDVTERFIELAEKTGLTKDETKELERAYTVLKNKYPELIGNTNNYKEALDEVKKITSETKVETDKLQGRLYLLSAEKLKLDLDEAKKKLRSLVVDISMSNFGKSDETLTAMMVEDISEFDKRINTINDKISKLITEYISPDANNTKAIQKNIAKHKDELKLLKAIRDTKQEIATKEEDSAVYAVVIDLMDQYKSYTAIKNEIDAIQDAIKKGKTGGSFLGALLGDTTANLMMLDEYRIKVKALQILQKNFKAPKVDPDPKKKNVEVPTKAYDKLLAALAKHNQAIEKMGLSAKDKEIKAAEDKYKNLIARAKQYVKEKKMTTIQLAKFEELANEMSGKEGTIISAKWARKEAILELELAHKKAKLDEQLTQDSDSNQNAKYEARLKTLDAWLELENRKNIKARDYDNRAWGEYLQKRDEITAKYESKKTEIKTDKNISIANVNLGIAELEAQKKKEDIFLGDYYKSKVKMIKAWHAQEQVLIESSFAKNEMSKNEYNLKMLQAEQDYNDQMRDIRREEFEETNPLSAITAGMKGASGSLWSTVLDDATTGSEKWKAIWESMQSAALSALDTVTKRLLDKAINKGLDYLLGDEEEEKKDDGSKSALAQVADIGIVSAAIILANEAIGVASFKALAPAAMAMNILTSGAAGLAAIASWELAMSLASGAAGGVASGTAGGAVAGAKGGAKGSATAGDEKGVFNIPSSTYQSTPSDLNIGSFFGEMLTEIKGSSQEQLNITPLINEMREMRNAVNRQEPVILQGATNNGLYTVIETERLKQVSRRTN